MNILVIESSPHKKGSSNLLAEEFIRGAKESGHSIEIFDAGHADLHPCLGCDFCGMNGPCTQKDDMAALWVKLLTTDMIVFVTPLYYFGVSAQLKTVIDRFYNYTGKLSGRKVKTALIVAAWDSNEWTMESIQSYYQTLCRYMNFQDQGSILGVGCGAVSQTRGSRFPRLAYEFGKSLTQ